MVSTTELSEPARLAVLARGWEAEDDTAGLLDAVVAAALALVPGAEAGSVSLLARHGQVTFEHASAALPVRVDAIQDEVDEGPCLDAARLVAASVSVPDLWHEQRWPRFASRAAQAGAGSMMSLRLAGSGGAGLGALNLVSSHPYAFEGDAERVGLHLATHAAIAYGHALAVDDLTRAVAGRDRIGQAKGLLMERLDLDADQAFAVLVRASQHSHRKLRDVADDLVATRRLDGLDG